MSNIEILEINRDKESVYNFLNKIPLFDKLDRDELYILLKYMGYTKVKKDTVLFREGDQADYVYFIANGCLDVIKSIPHDNQVVITSLHKGRSIGEMAILENVTRSATIKARIDSTLLLIGKQSFEKMLADHHFLAIKVLKGLCLLLSQNLRKTSSRLADYMLPLG